MLSGLSFFCRIGICDRSERIIPGNKKASLEDPGGLHHDACVICLPSWWPPAGKRPKGKAESAQSCDVPRTGLRVSRKGTDICCCDAHSPINAHQPSFVNGLIYLWDYLRPIGTSRNDDSPHFSLRQPLAKKKVRSAFVAMVLDTRIKEHRCPGIKATPPSR